MLQTLICNILFVSRDIGFHKRTSNSEFRETEEPRGGLEGPQPLQAESAAATCALRGAFLLKQSVPCGSKNAFLAPFYAQESHRDERKRRFKSIKWRIHLIERAVQQPRAGVRAQSVIWGSAQGVREISRLPFRVRSSSRNAFSRAGAFIRMR